MNSRRKAWSLGWRLAVCAVLMLWILHAIFMKEGRLALISQGGGSWTDLSRWEQWKAAWYYGPRELWHVLGLIEPTALLTSLVLMGLTILLGVIRWRMVLRVQGLDLPFSRAMEISLIAHFFNSFLLGSTGGDLFKAYYAARETHHKKTEAVVTVFVDRLIGLFAMLLFACLMMLPNLTLLSDHGRLRAWAAVILAMMLGCGLLAGLSFWGGISLRWTQAESGCGSCRKATCWSDRLKLVAGSVGKGDFFFWAMALSMALNVICVLQVLVLAGGLSLEIPARALFVIVPIIICISALPITPSGLGVRENLYVLMLGDPSINIVPIHALSVSLLAYAGSLFWSLVGGIVYVCLKQTQHLEEVTAETRPESAYSE